MNTREQHAKVYILKGIVSRTNRHLERGWNSYLLIYKHGLKATRELMRDEISNMIKDARPIHDLAECFF